MSEAVSNQENDLFWCLDEKTCRGSVDLHSILLWVEGGEGTRPCDYQTVYGHTHTFEWLVSACTGEWQVLTPGWQTVNLNDHVEKNYRDFFAERIKAMSSLTYASKDDSLQLSLFLAQVCSVLMQNGIPPDTAVNACPPALPLPPPPPPPLPCPLLPPLLSTHVFILL